MTIREHFQRQFKWTKNAAVGGAIVLCIALTVFFPQATRAQTAVACLLIGFAIGGALMLANRRRYLCPRCGEDLGKLQGQQGRQLPVAQRLAKLDARMFYDAWNACPKCGVSFEEEWRAMGP